MDKFFEELKPLFKTGLSLTTNNEYINPFVNYSKQVTLHKLEEFAKNIEEKTQKRREVFLEELTDEEIPIFLEGIRKVMNFDDDLQIYIMTQLLLNFKLNKELNYQEKSLYYNIQPFTKEDFEIYYCYYKHFISDQSLVSKIKRKLDEDAIKESDLIESVLRKFKSIYIYIYIYI